MYTGDSNGLLSRADGIDLPAVVRERRQAAGLTQRELAVRAGVSLGLLRDLEQSRTSLPRDRSVTALLAALNLPSDLASLRRPALGRPPRSAVPRSALPRSTPPRLAPPRPVGDSDRAPAGEGEGGGRAGGGGGELRIGLLGPLIIHRGPVELWLGSGMQRAVLGRLALAANTVVATRDLVDLLWSGTGPRWPSGAVQTHVWRIRCLLDPARPQLCRRGLLGRAPGGYRLTLGDDQLDVTVFRQGVRAAATAAGTDPGGALDLLDVALGQWRGRPLTDVDELADHPAVTALLDEQVAAVIGYADLATAVGRPHRALPWLRQVTEVQPLHEALQARLVGALAATGRQADALGTYQRVRRRLADELGIDPGAELRSALRRVLRQESAPRAGQRFGAGRRGSLRITTPSTYSA